MTDSSVALSYVDATSVVWHTALNVSSATFHNKSLVLRAATPWWYPKPKTDLDAKRSVCELRTYCCCCFLPVSLSPDPAWDIQPCTVTRSWGQDWFGRLCTFSTSLRISTLVLGTLLYFNCFLHFTLTYSSTSFHQDTQITKTTGIYLHCNVTNPN